MTTTYRDHTVEAAPGFRIGHVEPGNVTRYDVMLAGPMDVPGWGKDCHVLTWLNASGTPPDYDGHARTIILQRGQWNAGWLLDKMGYSRGRMADMVALLTWASHHIEGSHLGPVAGYSVFTGCWVGEGNENTHDWHDQPHTPKPQEG